MSSRPVRVIVVNADEEAGPELRALLLSVEGVKIVAEIDEPALLGRALTQFPAEVLLVHLDPDPHATMELIAPLVTERKERLAAIGMTEDKDAELVVRAMRAGMREFLWKPFPPEQLTDILRRLGNEGTAATQRAGRLIPVVAGCGGVGATTVATNLAVELAQLRSWDGGTEPPKVAIVDLDFRFGQVAMFLDAQATYTIAELCDTPEHIEPQMIERVMVKHPTGVHVLAIPHDVEQSQRISAAQTAGVLAALLEHYDFVVLDGPVRLDPTAQAVFSMTDIYLIVLQLLVPAVRNTDRLLRELGRGGYNLDQVRLVCNRFGREGGFLEPADVEATLGRSITWSLPDDWKTAVTSVNVGAPLLESAPKSKLRAAFQDMAASIARRTPAADAGKPAAKEPARKKLIPFFS
ncbi:MAG: AAA family ATPase [Phycisphaerales bacterium]|nr:AAA family ATPase [Phycisphaerales bacterium]